MLQQTQVARVVPKYHEFLAPFSHAGRPARPHRRATSSRSGPGSGTTGGPSTCTAAAVVIVAEHQGRGPRRSGGLAGATGYRSLHRARRARSSRSNATKRSSIPTWLGCMPAGTAGRSTSGEVQEVADAAVPEGQGWAWNQGMLDLGATVCTKRTPACDLCPARPWCAWTAVGCGEPDPADGSAGVSGRQSRFEGSDRQGRGRLVDALRRNDEPHRRPAGCSSRAGPTTMNGRRRVAATLVQDGLAVRRRDGSLALPD